MTTFVRGAGAACALALLLIALEPALAQTARHPFAVGGAEGPAAASGFFGLVLSWQNKFHQELTMAVRALKGDPSALLALLGASFAYGVFHAAGPGHGKAVLSAYMVANETALRRGLLLAALAALLQGLIAIALVGTAALLFDATAKTMTDAATLIELFGYVAMALLGARLVWSKGKAFVLALRAAPQTMFAPAPADGFAYDARGPISWTAPVAPPPAASSRPRFACEAVDDPAHVHDACCGHLHAIDPAQLGAGFSWRGALAAVVAAGLRPCSGAILVLVFTLSQGLFAAGAGAVLAMSAGTAVTTGALAALAVYAKSFSRRLGGADSRRSLMIGRGLELAAALLVLGLGLALLAGMGAARGTA